MIPLEPAGRIACDGSERAISDSAAPIWGDDGTVKRAVLVLRDVTRERRQEKMLREGPASSW